MLNFGVEFDEGVLRVKWLFQVSAPNRAGSCELLKKISCHIILLVYEEEMKM